MYRALKLIFSTMSVVMPGKLVEALVVELLLTENGRGIQEVKEMKELLTRKKHMIHGQEMRNHKVRGLTAVFGAMMNSSSWILIHNHLPRKDEHLGKRRSHWTLKMWMKQKKNQSR
ncbi:uncharacterized protein LOC116146989 [Pistacia vera]|uniref:uncharacterized protein LOC116146989 n=1 Tax=Pistacia vera TaxID=55513 RepID=UPI0012630691|nr:uncharacterized protein LOC116146989 [Pistacia vera]